MKKNKVIIYTDGASRGNPGESGAGFVIYNENGDTVFEGYKYLGTTTNNQAEYTACLLALKKALELGANEIEIRSDSRLLIRQIKGEYRVKSPNITDLFVQVRSLLSKFGKTTFIHVPREQNKKADFLANLAIDSKEEVT